MPASRHNIEAHTVTPESARWPGNRLSAKQRLDSLLLQSVDAGLAATVFVVPLLMGGRQALGQLALVALALWIAVCWCLRQALTERPTWVRSPVEILLLAALGFVGLQLAALPSALVDRISPRLYDLLPLWTHRPGPSTTLGIWDTLSLAPAATQDGLILLVAFALLILTTLQRVRHERDVERLLRWIAMSALVMAVFGLVQLFTSNGKFFWFYEHPFYHTLREAKGSFGNPNHFSHFLALGAGPMIWWVWLGFRRDVQGGAVHERRFGSPGTTLDLTAGLRLVALAVCVFAVLMSLSRGGALALMVAALTCTLIFYRGSLIGGRTVLTLVVIGAIVAAGLLVYGYESVASQLDDFASLGELDKGQGRRKLWVADLAAMTEFPVTGTGLGSHAQVYRMYLAQAPHMEKLEYTHAESGYVQVGLEAGLPGLALTLTALGLCGYYCVAPLRRGVSSRTLASIAAVAGSLAASAVHAIADFVWYVPGCMVIVAVLAACACRLWQLSRDGQRKSAAEVTASRLAWSAGAVGLIVIGTAMVWDRAAAVPAETCWHRYLALRRSLNHTEEAERAGTLRAITEELGRLVKWQPDHARAHLALAGAYLERFEQEQRTSTNSLGLRDIRDAALASRFPSPAALEEWLRRAVGPGLELLRPALHHARRALALCPLQGQAYLYLAELSFLEGPTLPTKEACVAQALKVRPFDGPVLLEAGKEAARTGNFDEALAHWRAAFHAGAAAQQALLEELAPSWPAEVLLETFQPDLQALKFMSGHYRRAKLPNGLPVVLRRYAEASESEAGLLKGTPAAEHWMDAAEAYGQLEEQEGRLRCLRQAVHCDPSHFSARYELGKVWYALGEFLEAERHLTWCAHRKPGDTKLRALLEATVIEKLRNTGRPGGIQPQAPRVTRRPDDTPT